MIYYRLVSFTGTCWELQQWNRGDWDTLKTFPYMRGWKQALSYYHRNLWKGNDQTELLCDTCGTRAHIIIG